MTVFGCLKYKINFDQVTPVVTVLVWSYRAAPIKQIEAINHNFRYTSSMTLSVLIRIPLDRSFLGTNYDKKEASNSNDIDPGDIVLLLTTHNWQKWKRVFLTCPCHEIYRDEAVGLKSCKYTWKITIYVKMLNLGNFVKIWYLVNNCSIQVRI